MRDARLTITSNRFLIEKRKFKLSPFGEQKWIPVMDMDINDPIELSLDKRGKCVLINGDGDAVKICAGDISIEKLMKEIERNIVLARKLEKGGKFSSKKIIADMKKERSIK